MPNVIRHLWLHYKSEVGRRPERKEETDMAGIKVSVLPVLRGGPGKINVGIRSNGQIALSGEASKALGASKYIAFTNFDEKSRVLEMRGLEKVPVKIAGETYGEADVKTLTLSKKTKQASFAGAGLCQYLKYDYKASGNQTFDAEVNAEKHTVSFTFPKGALEAKPVTHRASKKAKTVAAAAGASAATAAAPAEAEDLELS